MTSYCTLNKFIYLFFLCNLVLISIRCRVIFSMSYSKQLVTLPVFARHTFGVQYKNILG